MKIKRLSHSHVHMEHLPPKRCPLDCANAKGIFQRCMMPIFSDMIEEGMEIFMNDFSLFGSTFDQHLETLVKFCRDLKVPT